MTICVTIQADHCSKSKSSRYNSVAALQPWTAPLPNHLPWRAGP
jgi:hypothetical protein